MYKSFRTPQGKTVYLLDHPDECPECHSTTTPNYHHFFICNKDNNILYAFLTCPNPKCEKGYAAEYESENHSSNPAKYNFTKIIKGRPRKTVLSQSVADFSPKFEKIYNESFHAEQINLEEIAGVGYRKSLEYLIKDYLIKNIPKEAEKIKKSTLSQCINNWVDDPRIKKVSKRASWLGNDQTHYEKKWKDKDLTDLKLLIKLTVNWIESEILTEQLDIEMPE